MYVMALLGVMAVAFGAGQLLRAIGVPWIGSGDVFGFENPGTIGAIWLPIGLLLLGIAWRTRNSATRSDGQYAPLALAFAAAIRDGNDRALSPPRRPGDVFGAHENYMTHKPLDEDQISDLSEERLFEVLAELLESCGEAQTLLGVTQLRLKDAQFGQDQRLDPAWVIDRVWPDGRRFTEWLCVVPRGKRLQLAGGAAGHGPILGKTSTWDIIKALMWPAVCIGFATSGATILAIFVVAGIFLYGGSSSINQSQFLKFSEKDRMPDPYAVIRTRFDESELHAARSRVSDALAEIVPPDKA